MFRDISWRCCVVRSYGRLRLAFAFVRDRFRQRTLFFSLFRLAIIVLFLFFLCLALGSHFFDNNTPVQLAFHIGTSEYIGHMETPQTYGCPNEQHHTTYLHIVYGMY